jgi:1-acyl-sn-glycerol-3-phosphate acyltransferase
MPEPTETTLSYRFTRFTFSIFFRIWFRWKVLHRERVPAEGGVILASNHVSYLDPVYVVSALERMVVGLARESAFNVPLGGRILRSWRVIPVDQTGTGRGLKTFLSRLRSGDAVIMYPEGTRSPTGQIRAPQPGIGLIIIKSTAPVVPIKLFGAYEAYARHHWLPRPYQVQIKFGEPLDFADLRAEAKQMKDKDRLKEIYKQAATDLLHAIAQIEPGLDQEVL